MLNKKHLRLITFFIGYSGYLVPRPPNDYTKVSKSMHPFLLGKRDIDYFYDLEKSLYGIRATLEVLKNIVANEGRVLFVSNSFVVRPKFASKTNIHFLKSKRGSLSKSKKRINDLVFLTEAKKENLVEAQRKCLLLVGIGSPTMTNISYPFNINLNSPFLSNWFFNALQVSCRQGKSLAKKKKKTSASFLGKGKSKKFNSINAT